MDGDIYERLAMGWYRAALARNREVVVPVGAMRMINGGRR